MSWSCPSNSAVKRVIVGLDHADRRIEAEDFGGPVGGFVEDPHLETRCDRICGWISWMLPAASSLPRSMMPIDVQKSASSERIWLEIRIVLPICLSSFKSAFISSRALGSRPEAGSSRIKTGGSWTRVLARQSRCFIPLESPLT